MIPIQDVVEKESAGRGFTNVKLLHGSTFKDNSMVIITPTRGLIHHKVIQSWESLIYPMNQRRARLYATGDEVGIAYNKMIQDVLDNPVLSDYKYVLCLEDDNVIPPDAVVRLLESISLGFDGVGGLYFTKGDFYQMPMCYGSPEKFATTGVLEFTPRNISDFIKEGRVVPCNGIAQGCSLFKMSLFKEIPAPWFVTVADIIPEKGVQCFTQDLYFAERCKRAAKTFACDTAVKVGHLDTVSGIIY